MHFSFSRHAFASSLVPLAIVLTASCTAESPHRDPLGPSATSNGGGLTDQERACLTKWVGRSLPPVLEAAVPPAIGRQPALRSIDRWDGDVVAFSGSTAYRVDHTRGRLIPVEIPNCPSILDLEENASSLFALCSSPGDLHVITRAKGRASAWEVSLDLREDDFFPKGPLEAEAKSPTGRLAVSESAVAVVGAEAFWWRSVQHPKWKRHKLALPDTPRVYESRLPPDIAFMAPGALLLGWDFGEFGNWFYRMEVDTAGASTAQPDRILAAAVHSIARGEGGVVWVGAGGFHMVAATGQVLALEGRTVRKVLDESASRCEPVNNGLRLPQPAAIEGLALDGEGRPLVLVGDLGVFRIDGETLAPVIRGRTIHSYSLDSGATMTDHPVGIAATERGIFVASRSLGVFAFLERDQGYEFSQIVLR